MSFITYLNKNRHISPICNKGIVLKKSGLFVTHYHQSDDSDDNDPLSSLLLNDQHTNKLSITTINKQEKNSNYSNTKTCSKLEQTIHNDFDKSNIIVKNLTKEHTSNKNSKFNNLNIQQNLIKSNCSNTSSDECGESLYVKQRVTNKNSCKISNNKYCDKNRNVKLKKTNQTFIKNRKNEKDIEFGTACRQKSKRDPLPMKLRALPQSFWQQPNNTNDLSPGTVYPIIPPLSANTRDLNLTENHHERIISHANTDLLFSLFKIVEAEQRKIQGKRQTTVIKRGRPKKLPSSTLKSLLKDDDPCLVSTVTESILPLIPPDKESSNSLQAQITEGQQVLAMVQQNNILQNTNTEQNNYSQILSDLVIQL